MATDLATTRSLLPARPSPLSALKSPLLSEIWLRSPCCRSRFYDAAESASGRTGKTALVVSSLVFVSVTIRLRRLGFSASGVKGRCGASTSTRRAAVSSSAVSRAGDSIEEEGASIEERDCFQAFGVRGQRFDTVLSDHYSQSRSYFEVLIKKGAVLVNGRPQKMSFKDLRDGDLVDVHFQLDERSLPLKPEAIPLDIIYEDDELLVVNKQVGLVVHPAPGNWTGTLVNGVLHHIAQNGTNVVLPPAPPGPESHLRPGVAHRLDAGTSGAIAVTKTSAAFSSLSQAFARREVNKTYLAVVSGGRRIFRGHTVGGGYLIEHPIGRSSVDRRKMAVVPEAAGGRQAMSRVRCIAEELQSSASLLEVSPRTGRTHQIRVHLAEEQAPILGDNVYGAPVANRRFAQLARRPMLHAWRLAFAHPRTGERMMFEAPLPADMQALVRRMKPDESEQALFERLIQERENKVLGADTDP